MGIFYVESTSKLQVRRRYFDDFVWNIDVDSTSKFRLACWDLLFVGECQIMYMPIFKTLPFTPRKLQGGDKTFWSTLVDLPWSLDKYWTAFVRNSLILLYWGGHSVGVFNQQEGNVALQSLNSEVIHLVTTRLVTLATVQTDEAGAICPCVVIHKALLNSMGRKKETVAKEATKYDTDTSVKSQVLILFWRSSAQKRNFWSFAQDKYLKKLTHAVRTYEIVSLPNACVRFFFCPYRARQSLVKNAPASQRQ